MFRHVGPFILIALMIGTAGCNRSTATGDVAGKVTYDGKAVTEGRVTFQNPEAGTGDEALVNSDGAFVIVKPLPVGTYKVMVQPLIVRKQVDGKGPEVGVEKEAPDIPQKYRTIGTTDLTATVAEGKNDVKVEMKR